ncbi:hypothetical protein Kfla_0371 [Kribbella flavida DSM 17836]|uniref:Peptidase C39-like domain-containing protein n=1 Tax=Kribbella flavida (strain DSM 17836 / JCM 10339 / NBRC 14399) TaxID=479435 RepID=D2PUH7_KRIFD|nr:hypothetical protein [Kribbella flavida]ADB29495.1 hypothetical protein Kfla_0371 [Kribbella flavida DSM 17836]
MKRHRLSVLAGLTAATALFPAAGAYAAPAELPIAPLCAEQKDVAGPQYAVNLCDVTDADQFRTHLAAEGSSHCGPTSLYNAMYYLGEHKGLPMRITPNGQLLTEYDPGKPEDYDEVTAWIGWLGYKAGMGPNGGGSSTGENRAAFDAATVGAKAAGWTVNRGGIGTDNTPEFGLEIAKRLRQAPVQLWYGRYVLNADNTHSRTGGHAVTVVAAKGDVGSGKVELTLHDPARADDHKTPGYKDTQSEVRGEKVTLYRVAINVKSVSDDGVTTIKQRTYWRLFGEQYQGSTMGYVEAINWFEAAPPVG